MRTFARALAVVVLFASAAALGFGCGSSSDSSGAGNCDVMASKASLDNAKACCSSDQCKSNDCVTYSKGQYCSHACTQTSDCTDVTPLNGTAPKCGGMGVCSVGL